MFIRAVANAWNVGAGKRTVISKSELLDIALRVIPHFSAYEGQLKNVLFSALDFYDLHMEYQFHQVVSLLNIFRIYESIRQHNSIDGTLNQNHL